MRLEWSSFALADRHEIFDYIEAENPQAAIAVDARIEHSIEQLACFAESGRAGRIDGTRELVITGTPYIAAYRVGADFIRILRVLHGAQSWPDAFPE